MKVSIHVLATLLLLLPSFTLQQDVVAETDNRIKELFEDLENDFNPTLSTATSQKKDNTQPHEEEFRQEGDTAASRDHPANKTSPVDRDEEAESNA